MTEAWNGMTTLRVGTRGSALALWQTRWVCGLLRAVHPGLHVEEVVIKTRGDAESEGGLGAENRGAGAVGRVGEGSGASAVGGAGAGGFVGAIEEALLRGRIDFAVHSYKDLAAALTEGLVVAAVPPRAVVHDVLVTGTVVDLDAVPKGLRIGTSSPRRAAQWRRHAEVEIVAIRGNVPARIAKIGSDGLDGVVIAGAGVERLGLRPGHMVALPTDRFVPAAGQGALAVQARVGSDVAVRLGALDDPGSRARVDAERALLRAVGAGCDTPVAALATLDGDTLTLQGQLFERIDGRRMVEGWESGRDAVSVGTRLGERLIAALKEAV